jgi:hypothetical protein
MKIGTKNKVVADFQFISHFMTDLKFSRLWIFILKTHGPPKRYIVTQHSTPWLQLSAICSPLFHTCDSYWPVGSFCPVLCCTHQHTNKPHKGHVITPWAFHCALYWPTIVSSQHRLRERLAITGIKTNKLHKCIVTRRGYSDVVWYQRFGGPCCLHLQG